MASSINLSSPFASYSDFKFEAPLPPHIVYPETSREQWVYYPRRESKIKDILEEIGLLFVIASVHTGAKQQI